MDSNKKILKKIFMTSTLIFFIVGGFILFAPNKKRMEAQGESFIPHGEASHSFANGSHVLNGSPAMVAQDSLNYCQTLREKMPASIDEWKKAHPIAERFINVHKRVNGTIYRLRFFYKDHAEGDTPTYLLYVEDQNEIAQLIEKSSHKKGKEFSRIEAETGEIIHTEKGINVGNEESLFVHYVNAKLKGFQGTIPELDSSNSGTFIDCRF